MDTDLFNLYLMLMSQPKTPLQLQIETMYIKSLLSSYAPTAAMTHDLAQNPPLKTIQHPVAAKEATKKRKHVEEEEEKEESESEVEPDEKDVEKKKAVETPKQVPTFKKRRLHPYTFFVKRKRPEYMKKYPKKTWKEIAVMVGADWRGLSFEEELEVKREMEEEISRENELLRRKSKSLRNGATSE